MPAVLVLDDDLGFAMWLASVLNDAGYTVLPSSTSEEALAIANYVASIDLVIANFGLDGCSTLLDTLSERGDQFRLIAIGDAAPPAGRQVQATLTRPDGPPKSEPYIKAVAAVLRP